MSRPYLTIQPTFNSSNDVVDLNVTAIRLRGVTALSLTGLSQSISTTITNGYYVGSLTFSANLNGSTAQGDANTIYTPSNASIAFSGSASNNANVKITLPLSGGSGGTPILGAGGYTFSATQSLPNALDMLVGSMNFTSSASGFSATVSGGSIVFTAPANTGAYYNSWTVTSAGLGLGTFTFSNGASFASGTSKYLLDMNPIGSYSSYISSPTYLTVQ